MGRHFPRSDSTCAPLCLCSAEGPVSVARRHTPSFLYFRPHREGSGPSSAAQHGVRAVPSPPLASEWTCWPRETQALQEAGSCAVFPLRMETLYFVSLRAVVCSQQPRTTALVSSLGATYLPSNLGHIAWPPSEGRDNPPASHLCLWQSLSPIPELFRRALAGSPALAPVDHITLGVTILSSAIYLPTTFTYFDSRIWIFGFPPLPPRFNLSFLLCLSIKHSIWHIMGVHSHVCSGNHKKYFRTCRNLGLVLFREFH